MLRQLLKDNVIRYYIDNAGTNQSLPSALEKGVESKCLLDVYYLGLISD